MVVCAGIVTVYIESLSPVFPFVIGTDILSGLTVCYTAHQSQCCLCTRLVHSSLTRIVMYTHELLVAVCFVRKINEWINDWMNEWANELTDGATDGYIEKKGEWIDVHYHLKVSVLGCQRQTKVTTWTQWVLMRNAIPASMLLLLRYWRTSPIVNTII